MERAGLMPGETGGLLLPPGDMHDLPPGLSGGAWMGLGWGSGSG